MPQLSCSPKLISLEGTQGWIDYRLGTRIDRSILLPSLRGPLVTLLLLVEAE